MLLEILEKDKVSIFLKKEKEPVLQQFFPTANYSVKKKDLLEVGEFDTSLITCEDMDLSFRFFEKDFKLYRNINNKMAHFYRSTYKGLLKQWFDYGLGHPIVYLKHEKRKGIFIYMNFKTIYSFLKLEEVDDIKIARIPYFKYGYVAIDAFNIFFIASVLGLLVNNPYYWLLVLFLFIFNFTRGFNWKRPIVSTVYSFYRISINASYLLGGLLSGLSRGTLAIESSWGKNPKISHD